MRDITTSRLLVMSLDDVKQTDGQSVSGSTEESSLPTLAAILACREASSGIMEHEKTILVMKEHDYAKTPDMTQLAPFFRYLSEERETKVTTKKKPVRKGSELFNVRQALADARTSLVADEGPFASHLNSMVSLQATLINHLQEQVFLKGLETTTVRREKEQLEARLQRMERRLSVLQKRPKRKEDPEITTTDETALNSTGNDSLTATPPLPNSLNTPPSVQAKPEQLSRLARSDSVTSRNSRSRSSSIEAIGRRHSRASSTSLDITHRAVKRTLQDGSGTCSSASKKTRSFSPTLINEHILTNEEYTGLGLVPVDNDLGPVVNGGLLPQPSSCHQHYSSAVKVPSWRDVEVPHPSSFVGCNTNVMEEDFSDDSFSKRHSKPENEERRRKRWDAQQMRERLKCDQLLKRYMSKEGTSDKKKDKIVSFRPKIEDIQQIEITDSLVVSAFGKPIPSIRPSNFVLVNFDPTAHVKSTRGKLKGKMGQNGGTATGNET